MTEKPTKEKLYELYWEQELSKDKIAARYDMSRKQLRRHMKALGVRYTERELRDVFVFRMRSRRYYYQLYWGSDRSLREIASQHNISQQCVISTFKAANVPRGDEGKHSKWFDKERGVPKKYKRPRDENPQQDQSLPDDPDPEKYLAETPLHRDKDRLYELHWEYGCSASLINAMADTANHIHDCMRKLGIPVRSYERHKDWEPHYDVIPPMFEWPHDRNDGDANTVEWSLSDENMATGD